MKKLSEPKKVKLLETTTQAGTLEELKAVLDDYQPFEYMGGALGIAAHQRGVAFVELLVNYGATFWYPDDGDWNRKYGLYWQFGTSSGRYRGRPYLGEWKIPLDEKLAVVKFFMEHPEIKASEDDILYQALMSSDLEFADALMEMGINLDRVDPNYYKESEMGTYLGIICCGDRCIYWMDYVDDIAGIPANQLLPVLQRLHHLAAAAGRKLALSADAFGRLHWDKDTLVFAFDHMDLSKVERNKDMQKFGLKTAILTDCVPVLAKMIEANWHKKPEALLEWINFATEHQKPEPLAWLIDYRNRTVDVAAEEAKAEAKRMRELTEDPNSVSALKKIWSYKKLEDGTLVITSYKGQETEVTVPAKIGKSMVSAIGEEAFYPYQSRVKNKEVRKNLTKVVLPEGITEIGRYAFHCCDGLRDLWLPDVKKLGYEAFPWCWSNQTLVLHTTEGSDLAERVWKISVVYDYENRDQ